MTCIDCGQAAERRLCDPCRIRLEGRAIRTAYRQGWPTVIDELASEPKVAAVNDEGIFDRTVCEDCSQPSMAGGRWCLRHFQKRAKPVRRVACGASGGYDRHRRNGTEPCAACLEQRRIDQHYRKASA